MATSRDAWGKERADAVKAAFYEYIGHVQINSKEKGWIILGQNLYGGQRRAIEEIFDGLAEGIHDFKILKSRQLGISTIIRALMLFWAGIFDGLTGSLVFDTAQHLDEARKELVAMLERLPDEFEFPRVKGNNRYSLEITNQSRINLASAGVKASKTSGTLGRGSAVSLNHRSELCSYGNVTGLEAYRASLARTNPNRLFVDESTATGFNIWHEIWTAGKKDHHCKCMFFGWWSHPDQIITQDDPDWEKYGIFPPTKEEAIKIEAVWTQYQHRITPEQLAWIRREMDPTAEPEGDADVVFEGDALRRQEQPWCVTRETRVGTSAGIIPIDEARPGMGATLCDVMAAGPTGKAPIWRMRTALGYEVRGTANHPIIQTNGEEVRLDSSLGSRVKLQGARFSEEPYVVRWRDGLVDCSIGITEDVGRFVGLFMGDGSASAKAGGRGNTEVSICCDTKDEDVVAECARLFRDVFGAEVYQNRTRPGWVSVRSGSGAVFRAIQRLGLTRTDIGKTMRRVHIPEFIWRSPKSVVREFLIGLFEADGFNGFDTHRVALFSKYPEFIADIQRLLLAFGITSRAVSMRKKAGDGHFYTGNQLELRTSEAKRFNEEIGFISDRKRSRINKPARTKPYKRGPINRPPPPIVFEDTVVEVVDEGIEEEVYNLTVSGDHLFDANGILTHNTEEEAFQQTGSVFFQAETLTNQSNKFASNKFTTYAFTPGIEFTDMRAVKAGNMKSVELKVWEEPVEDSFYIVAADVAYGHDENNDRSAVQVVRCFSDGLDQVAEYAWPLINTRQFAWVIAALEGWYAGDKSQVYRMVEINGPGESTWNELQALKRQIGTGYFGNQLADRGLQNIQRNVRNYMYTRSDSSHPGRAYQWKSNTQLKVAIMERLRDFTSNGILRIRSTETLEEMRTVAREGDAINAQGTAKDDRVVSLAMAVRCWDERVRRQLLALKRTREADTARRRLDIRDQVKMFNDNMITTYLGSRRAGRQAMVTQARRQAWRGR